MEDVMPFLENVTRGRRIPKERLQLVAEQYYQFGGTSSINQENRSLIKRVEDFMLRQGFHLPIYFGNRNWTPYIQDTVREMIADGITKALVFATSAYSSYSSCRQYLEDIERAKHANLENGFIELHKIRGFYNHPKFLSSLEKLTLSTFSKVESPSVKDTAFITTAHSIPLEMASTSDYEEQIKFVSSHLEFVTVKHLGEPYEFFRAFQSRSGSPSQPWLEPDIGDKIEELAKEGFKRLVVVPIGFISDHQEVRYDLDTLAHQRALHAGVNLYRVPTVSHSDDFVEMVVDLVSERLDPNAEIKSVGVPLPNFCSSTCCRSPKT